MKRFVIIIFLLFMLTPIAFSETLQTKPLPKEVKSYIEKQYSIKSKKLVLYTPFFEESTCPHTQYFLKYLKHIMQQKDKKEVYVLKKKSVPSQNASEKAISAYEFLISNCQYLCVVNLKKNWIYTINPMGRGFSEDDTVPLSMTLTALRNR